MFTNNLISIKIRQTPICEQFLGIGLLVISITLNKSTLISRTLLTKDKKYDKGKTTPNKLRNANYIMSSI